MKKKLDKKIKGVQLQDILKTTKLEELQDVVEEVNRADLTWKAKIPEDLKKKSLEEVSKEMGIYQKRESLKFNEETPKFSKEKKQPAMSSFIQTKMNLNLKVMEFKKKLHEPLKEVKKPFKKSEIKRNKHDKNEKRDKDSHFVTDPKEILKYINSSIDEIDEKTLPLNWDWRDVGGKNYVSNVAAQGNCGSCYAIATMAILESRLRIKTLGQDQTKFSTQFPLSCSYYSEGCEGGFPVLLSKFLAEYEIVPESCYPYQYSDGDCKQLCDYEQFPTRYFVKDYGYIGGFYGAANEVDMMKELRARGPIVGNIIVDENFYIYNSGIYSTKDLKKNSGHFDKTKLVEDNIFFEKVEHTTTIVGYGEEDGVKYWICQNSWGPDWGESGYFRIKTGDCGINDDAVAGIPDV